MDTEKHYNASPHKCFSQFNDFIKKNIKLKNLKLESLPKNVIPIIPISRNFQYHHHILESNTSKTITVNRYQLPIAPTFCLTYFKAQGQTFDNVIIDLWQPMDNVHLNMHNIYITLSHLRSIDGFIILQNITMQDICKASFKKGSQKCYNLLQNII